MKEKRTYKDRRQSIIKAVAKRRKKIRQMTIEYKGGKCSKCGYSKCQEALDFHHIGGKDFGISDGGITRSWEKTRRELEKCILICANCHRELHSSLKLQPREETLE